MKKADQHDMDVMEQIGVKKDYEEKAKKYVWYSWFSLINIILNVQTFSPFLGGGEIFSLHASPFIHQAFQRICNLRPDNVQIWKVNHVLNNTLYYSIGLRWCLERDILSGKGKEICGNKHCSAVSTA